MKLVRKVKHASLFSGIGGFDLAAKWIGWENVFQVERDEWCRKILAKHYPNTCRFKDIKEFKANEYTNTIDVISGGFPCQPFSTAGKRKSKEDDRYLWPEMLRVIREIRPPFVVGENVAGIINLALDTVLFDLEDEGYTTETFVIPACGKDAPHKRDRVWIVAYSGSFNGWSLCRSKTIRRIKQQKIHEFSHSSFISHTEYDGRVAATQPGINGENVQRTQERGESPQQLEGIRESGNVANSQRIGQQEPGQFGVSSGSEKNRQGETNNPFNGGVSGEWPVEPGICRVANGVPNRVHRLRGLGNAVVPQIPYEIFKAINSLLA